MSKPTIAEMRGSVPDMSETMSQQIARLTQERDRLTAELAKTREVLQLLHDEFEGIAPNHDYHGKEYSPREFPTQAEREAWHKGYAKLAEQWLPDLKSALEGAKK